MFTEDYLMRIINQAIAAFLVAMDLRKKGKYSEAQQIIRQTIEGLTSSPANLVDQLDDDSVLALLTMQEQLDIGRLAVLADLYQEQGEILFKLDQPAQGRIVFASALRFFLEVALSDADALSAGNIGKVDALTERLKGYALPDGTQLALSDYYQRLLEKDDESLIAAGTSRARVIRELAGLQDQMNLKRSS